jgi:hypothetical protein
VNVGIQILRHIVIYNVRNPLHVDTASRDIGCDQDTVSPVLKSVERLLTLALREVTVQRCNVLTTTSELLSETLRGVFHLGEHNHEGFAILLQPMRENLRLCLLRNLVHRVSDRGVRVLNLHLHKRWIVENAVR